MEKKKRRVFIFAIEWQGKKKKGCNTKTMFFSFDTLFIFKILD